MRRVVLLGLALASCAGPDRPGDSPGRRRMREALLADVRARDLERLARERSAAEGRLGPPRGAVV